MARAKASTMEIQRLSIAPHKGRELIGLLLATLALLLAASLVSFHPDDPSLLHQVPGKVAVHNWIGPVGAQLSALLLALIGLASLLIPVGLLFPAWRLLRSPDTKVDSSRSLGFILLFLTLPVLLQLLSGALVWRGREVDAGGVLGRFLAEGLTDQLNFGGALLVTVALLLGGVSLFAQSTLHEVAGAWSERLRERLQGVATLRAKKRQRKERDEVKQRVVAKHLRRREKEAAETVDSNPVIQRSGVEVEVADLPLRVVEKKGVGGFSVRRRKAAGDIVASPPSRSVPQGKLFGVAKRSEEDAGLPPLNLMLLEENPHSIAEDELIRLGELIRQSCEQFGVQGTIAGISPGPVITVFEFKPAPGVKMSQIVNLQDDLALALKADSVRIDRLAGRATLGIEVPNKVRTLIRLGPILAAEAFRHSPSPLTMALGQDIHGQPYYADLATMPHLLVAGATGAGKSVGLQSMITSILYKATREEVQFIFIDPKRVELGVYADIPHLKTEVVVEPKKAANALRWAVAEMERRYRLLAEVHVRSIDFYNRAIADPEVQERLNLDDNSEITPADLKPLPYYVIVIDELADLMMVAANDVETSIARLAQMARAVGIHLIVATQRPSVDVITGTIKANFPCRIAFATTSRHDSKTILDTVGSEKLLGKGDLLIMPPGTSRIKRLHGAYISEQETAGIIRWLKKQGKPELDPEVVKFSEGAKGEASTGGDNDDELYDDASRLVVAERKASASYLQRRMRIGFSRASRLIDMMEQDGLLGPSQGSKPREVLVPVDFFSEVDATQMEG
ncbi:MAG: DNA translocase FtsK 4TM domain-containing protein [Thermoanaerobaculia bacterium]|nr:DNA translocase FtsK 4TM domain-containing protein [Thermoanaerobaculia bacterium]